MKSNLTLTYLTVFFCLWQILQILVKAVVENLTDRQGEQAVTLKSKLKELLGRVSSRHSTDSEIWRQYALLYGDGHSSNPEDNEKVGFTASIPATLTFTHLYPFSQSIIFHYL